jgi:hypothetical protein
MTDDLTTLGWPTTDLDGVARRVDHALGVRLEPRHSLYRGDYYAWEDADGAELVLQHNRMEDDGELTEPDHSEYAVLLYASRLEAARVRRLVVDAGAHVLAS